LYSGRTCLSTAVHAASCFACSIGESGGFLGFFGTVRGIRKWGLCGDGCACVCYVPGAIKFTGIDDDDFARAWLRMMRRTKERCGGEVL
jgi:hypothetical protein